MKDVSLMIALLELFAPIPTGFTVVTSEEEEGIPPGYFVVHAKCAASGETLASSQPASTQLEALVSAIYAFKIQTLEMEPLLEMLSQHSRSVNVIFPGSEPGGTWQTRAHVEDCNGGHWELSDTYPIEAVRKVGMLVHEAGQLKPEKEIRDGINAAKEAQRFTRLDAHREAASPETMTVKKGVENAAFSLRGTGQAVMTLGNAEATSFAHILKNVDASRAKLPAKGLSLCFLGDAAALAYELSLLNDKGEPSSDQYRELIAKAGLALCATVIRIITEGCPALGDRGKELELLKSFSETGKRAQDLYGLLMAREAEEAKHAGNQKGYAPK